jgi:hypothetical protein
VPNPAHDGCVFCGNYGRALDDGTCQCSGNAAHSSDGSCSCNGRTLDSQTYFCTSTCIDPSAKLSPDGGSCACTSGAYLDGSGRCACPQPVVGAPSSFGLQGDRCCPSGRSNLVFGNELCICATSASTVQTGSRGTPIVTTCTCAAGAYLDPQTSGCVCPDGTSQNADNGQCDGSTACVSPMTTKVNGKCVCPNNMVLQPDGSCKCSQDNAIVDSSGLKCKCNSGFISSATSTSSSLQCISCGDILPYSQLDGTSCGTCPKGASMQADGTCACPKGQKVQLFSCSCPFSSFADLTYIYDQSRQSKSSLLAIAVLGAERRLECA